MRRTTAILLLPLAALSACATGGGEGIPTTLRSGIEGGGAANAAHPLRVRLLDHGGQLSLDLNRRAHTAVFEIVPGQGVAMVYPSPGQREISLSGITYLNSTLARNHFWRYDNAGRSPYSFASAMAGPRHLLVVASERPLLTERFRRSTGMLRRALGTTSYTSLNSNRVVDDLLATVVPPQPDASWDADVITVFPAGVPRLPAGDLHRIRCGDGLVYWAPLELATAICRNPDRVLPPPVRADSVAPPVRPGDSTGVRQPGGRRPQPETDNGIRMARENLRSYRNGGLTADAREIRLTELRRSLAERRQEGTATASFRGRPGMRDSEGRPMPVSRPDAGSPRTYSNPAGSHTTYTATEQQRPTQSETRASGGETRNSPPEVRPATP
jgi:hypothetical protein